MNILFHSNQLSERGAEVALFDYALGNQNVLKNYSFIAAPKNRIFGENILDKFKQNFTVCLYESPKDVHDFAESNKIDLIYKIVHGGTKEEFLHDKIPHFIHCVFSTKAEHGTFYCPISECINKRFGTDYPVLPHIVKPFGIQIDKTVLRQKLGIPQNSIVFGCYGGKQQFNIPFVKKEVVEVAKKHSNIYFLFMNHEKFCDLPNVYFLPGSVDYAEKAHFIDACSAMLHARADGETFGLAVAEFSTRNKPVITWKPGRLYHVVVMFFSYLRKLLKKMGVHKKIMPNELFGWSVHMFYDKAHLEYCYKAITYTNKKDLRHVLENFENYYNSNENYDCYSERFSEKNVMETFRDIICKASKGKEQI